MTALVTGANGFVGAAVCRALCARDEPVRALVRANSDTSNLEALPVSVVVGDLRDRASLERAAAGCQSVFHVAADYRLWVPDPDVMYRINVDGTRHLLDAALAAGVERIVYTSSVATITPHADGTPANEDSASAETDMIGDYKRSKFLAEECVRDFANTHSAPIVIVNPSTPLGPGDVKPTPTGRIVLDALRGRIPAYVDTGLNIVHVDDVAAGHLAAFDRGRVGRRYILGGEDVSLKAMLGIIAELAGRRPPRVRIPHALALAYARSAELAARLGGGEPAATVDGVRMAMKKMYFSSHRAQAELGYSFRPAADTLASAVEWFRLRLAA